MTIKDRIKYINGNIQYLQGIAMSLDNIILAPTSEQGRKYFQKVTSELHRVLHICYSDMVDLSDKIREKDSDAFTYRGD